MCLCYVALGVVVRCTRSYDALGRTMYWVILFWSIVLISNVRTLLLFFTDHKFLFLDNVCDVDDDNDDDDDDVDNDDSIEPLTDKNRKFKPVPRLDGLPSAQPIAVFDTTVY